MSPNPILKVLSTMQAYEVRCLLMGGQACVLYGAAEFSRDTDLALLADEENLERLRRALSPLQAERIAIPPFDARYLLRGHAVHFRCAHPEAEGMRIDIMSVLRGLPGFSVLWERRSVVHLEGRDLDVLSLPDLVQAKKTQRDKDWPMIRRLIEADYLCGAQSPSDERIRFWFLEARTPALLRDLASRFPHVLRGVRAHRPLLAVLPGGADEEIERRLHEEQEAVRAEDRAYWLPLRQELESLRRNRA